MKNLIIVESPAKAKTITNFLDSNYTVVASKGHIRDLPKSNFGITIDEEKREVVPKYSIPKEASQTVKMLKDEAKKAQTVFIATDEDREGEAIGYHIAMAIGKEPESLPRIVFHEITKDAIVHALENPRTIDMNSVNAQQSRRLLDRIVGYKLSPLLASKIQKGLSAGRVQSSTLKIIVDKEREIKAFKPQEFWKIDAIFDSNIEATIVKFNDEKLQKLSISNEKMALEIGASARKGSYSVIEIDSSERKTKTPPPFMTSTLQQSASSLLGFSPKKTMMIAQKLYEGVRTPKGTMGVITYMRTDSLNIAKEALLAARDFIKKSFDSKYLPQKSKIYTTKSKGAQEAHEAIRPTMLDFTPEAAKEYLNADEIKLYRLIFNRFIASQMNDAIIESQSIHFSNGDCLFKASGRRLVFDGFYKIVGYSENEKLLPKLDIGQKVKLDDLSIKQHFTEPPARYSEASLIKELEQLGIGRPSTYAPTITILQQREYITLEKKRIMPTEIAFTVVELLEKHFEDIVNSNFTANMEEELDKIATGNADWQKLLLEFYTPFINKINKGKKEIPSLKTATPTGEACPQCGSELLLRKGRYGEFIACSGFPKCKYTKNTNEDEESHEAETTNEICDKCGSPMVIKNSRRGKFLACSAYPKCKNAKPLNPPKSLGIDCPECGSELQEREGRRGKFFGCSSYPKCKFITNYQPLQKRCPECDYLMVLKQLKSGNKEECLKCKYKIEL